MSNETLRGVNLGGWLVLERWITPSLFEGTDADDEYSFMAEPEAAEKIKWHRRTFIQEDDFAWLASHGVNAVRIPVGYWLFETTGPFTSCVEYLDMAMRMAERYKLKVLIDLHAAPGSQNGKDHSGKSGRAGWYGDADHVKQTIAVLRNIAERYKDSSALWGIELLNEPRIGPMRFFRLRRFYRDAYRELGGIVRPGTYIVFSDGFMPRLFSGSLRRSPSVPVAMDVHWYQFGKTSLMKYFKKLAIRSREIERLQRRQPVIIGEWSGMLSHKTLAGHSQAEQAHLQKLHIEKQLEVYGSALGWFYWTYKTETGDIWDFREQVENGNLLLR